MGRVESGDLAIGSEDGEMAAMPRGVVLAALDAPTGGGPAIAGKRGGGGRLATPEMLGIPAKLGGGIDRGFRSRRVAAPPGPGVCTKDDRRPGSLRVTHALTASLCDEISGPRASSR
jgi:hypothetical protein